MIREITHTIKHEDVTIDMSKGDSLDWIIKNDIKNIKGKDKNKEIKFVTWYGKNNLRKLKDNIYYGNIFVDYLERITQSDGRSLNV